MVIQAPRLPLFAPRPVERLNFTEEASTITYIVLGVPYHNYSVISPKTLF